MFYVLRLIIITALFVYGWAVAAGSPPDHEYPLIENVVLEAMPDIPMRQPRASKRKHRSPFIVPISPPNFGHTDELMEKSAAHPDLVRSSWPSPTQFSIPSFTVGDDLPAFDDSLFPSMKAARPVRLWASEIRPSATQLVNSSDVPSLATSKPVSVVGPNLKSLSERITLHNLGVAAIEDQLRARDSWKLKDLESVLAELQSLDESKQLWMMYWRLLDAKQRWHIGTPVTFSNCIDLLQQRVFETRVAISVNRFAVTSLSDVEATARLKRIERQLASMSNSVTSSTRQSQVFKSSD